MKKLLFLFILLVLLPLISSAETINGHEVEWGDGTGYTLSWTNPSISKGGYVIKIIDFNWKGDATLSVTMEGETKKGILSQGENTIFDFTKNTSYFKGVKIYATTVSNFLPFPTNIGTYPCCPAAEINVQTSTYTQKIPVLELGLSPNWDGRAGVASTMNIQIKNTGDADFREGNVTIDLNGLKIADDNELYNQALTYNPSKGIVTRGWAVPFTTNSSYSVNLSLKSPFPSNKSTFMISAKSYFTDNNGVVYQASTSATVTLNPTMELLKRITPATMFGERTFDAPEVDVGFSPKFFGLGKITIVNLLVKNSQSYSVKSVSLTDTIPEGFRLIDYNNPPTQGYRILDNDTKLQWVFDLNASEQKDFRYELAAQKTGSFTAPAALATWNEWEKPITASSSKPTTRVYGVFVVVSKKTDQTRLKLKESLNVTTTLDNIGDLPVGINVTDVLPKNATFISGKTSFDGYLYPKESVEFRYSFSAGYPEELKLPYPQVTFWKKEYENAYGIIPAGNITVFDPFAAAFPVATINETAAPTPAQTQPPKSLIDIVGEKAPWLEGAIPIFMLFVAIILMLLLHVINR